MTIRSHSRPFTSRCSRTPACSSNIAGNWTRKPSRKAKEVPALALSTLPCVYVRFPAASCFFNHLPLSAVSKMISQLAGSLHCCNDNVPSAATQFSDQCPSDRGQVFSALFRASSNDCLVLRTELSLCHSYTPLCISCVPSPLSAFLSQRPFSVSISTLPKPSRRLKMSTQIPSNLRAKTFDQ